MMKSLHALIAVALLGAGVIVPRVAPGVGVEVRLEPAPIDVRDLQSLQAGARTFVNYCLNCHSASLMRYNRLADLGLTEQQIKDNLMFTAHKTGEMMTISMGRKDAIEWFGTAPPDLSVTARSRGADWLYTYLRGFYRDPSSANGWNNTVFNRVAMPHVLWELQGERILVEEVKKDAAGREVKDSDGKAVKSARFETVRPGTLSAVEYSTVVRDLVAYMVWMAEPNQVLRKQVGVWVLFILSILVALTYALYKEYWKDVH